LRRWCGSGSKSCARTAQLRRLLTALTRSRLDELRRQDSDDGTPVSPGEVAAAIAADAGALIAGELHAVINASGVMLQTNLGRSPLSSAARARVEAIAAGYSNLEFELEQGTRGERARNLARTFVALLGAPALVVNNNAAALLLILTALARGREVVVSRGELIEIGGSFRLPDVMRLSGARLVEVGTTNRTRLSDYRDAIGPRTALLLKVHNSNYRVVGFTASVEAREVAALARENGILAIEDLGSGSLLPTEGRGMGHEPTVQEALAAGVHLCAFSGDKLLGGPQAGIIAGDSELVARLGRHPLYRAVRPDKLTLAALEGTLGAYLRGRAPVELPLWQMLGMTSASTRKRARAWAVALQGIDCEVVPVLSTVGGGALPGEEIKGYGLALGRPGARPSATTVAARLRRASPPVIARVHQGRVLLDPRTVLPEQDASLLGAVSRALH
jgi:L-seryl-tRNA(Ser) seleniumtransferase